MKKHTDASNIGYAAPGDHTQELSADRRQFIQSTLALAGALGLPANAAANESSDVSSAESSGHYADSQLDHIAFPMGGIGAGMVCLEGRGALSHLSVRNAPFIDPEPATFAAVYVRGIGVAARVLEGPVPSWKLSPQFGNEGEEETGYASWGLPRFRQATFKANFPFAKVALADADMPLAAQITGWSPFEAGAADDSSLPVAALEYELTNIADHAVDGVFSFNALNFMSVGKDGSAGLERGQVLALPGGFVLYSGVPPGKPWEEGAFAAWVDDPDVKVNHAWFRGREGWIEESMKIAWRDINRGGCYERPVITQGRSAPGASLFVPFAIAAGASKTIRLRLAWYVGASNVRYSGGGSVIKLIQDANQPGKQTYKPWYAGRFSGIQEVAAYWQAQYDDLRFRSHRFSQCFYDSTLPAEAIQAVAANLSILKSPTVLRQTDGRLWGWEGTCDTNGWTTGPGSCTHVWNYAQSIPHLFPALERSLRETEFGASLSGDGHQVFRAALPIRDSAQDHTSLPAADGQLGGIVKAYRDWRISGDTQWLRGLWPKVSLSLNFCIRTWDPRHDGWLVGVQHNTYDMPLLGPNGMCSSIYLAALKAAVLMGKALGTDVSLYTKLFEKGKARVERELFNGEFFIQKSDPGGQAPMFAAGDEDFAPGAPTPEATALAEMEGSNYQYGAGCLSDGVIGAWFAEMSGIDGVLDPHMVRRHLAAVFHHNFRADLSGHSNLMRPVFAFGNEGGLILCTWPYSTQRSLPVVYSSEVWTGIEYQVASHLIAVGMVHEGLEIVRTCRKRYDGRIRNPFGEVEAGHWYARAMSSYGLLHSLSGARYDAVEQVLYLNPQIEGDFRSFLASGAGYGTVGVRQGRPFLEVVFGTMPLKEIIYIKQGNLTRERSSS